MDKMKTIRNGASKADDAKWRGGMNNKLRTIPDPQSGFCMLGLLLFCLAYTAPGMAGEFDTYRYKLEENNNDKVCLHMAGVFSKYFKKPFNTINDETKYVKSGGVLPPLLPGAKEDLGSFINMRFSFQPTSPEFDAIKWQLGKETHHYHGEANAYLNTPFIAADMALNNDGQLMTVIKNEFMSCYIPGCYAGHSDQLFIFSKSDIDLLKGPIEWDVFFKGQNNHPPLAVMSWPHPTCDLVRPFIYDGVTYLSCYDQKWVKDYRNFHNRTPDREYTDVLKYQGVENMPPHVPTIKAETVCRFRMTVVK